MIMKFKLYYKYESLICICYSTIRVYCIQYFSLQLLKIRGSYLSQFAKVTIRIVYLVQCVRVWNIPISICLLCLSRRILILTLITSRDK